jgi:predicted nucleic acid-binding protein
MPGKPHADVSPRAQLRSPNHDSLIALTALEHDLELLTRDRRAVRSYRVLGVRFTLLE